MLRRALKGKRKKESQEHKSIWCDVEVIPDWPDLASDLACQYMCFICLSINSHKLYGSLSSNCGYTWALMHLNCFTSKNTQYLSLSDAPRFEYLGQLSLMNVFLKLRVSEQEALLALSISCCTGCEEAPSIWKQRRGGKD